MGRRRIGSGASRGLLGKLLKAASGSSAALASASQPELMKLSRACGVSRTKTSRKSLPHPETRADKDSEDDPAAHSRLLHVVDREVPRGHEPGGRPSRDDQPAAHDSRERGQAGVLLLHEFEIDRLAGGLARGGHLHESLSTALAVAHRTGRAPPGPGAVERY